MSYPAVLDLTDLSGPGCGQPNHDDACLCDVDLAAHPAPPLLPGDELANCTMGRALTMAADDPNGRNKLVAFCARYLPTIDKVDELTKVAESARLKIDPTGWNPHAATKDFVAILQSGKTLTEVSEMTGVSIVLILRSLTKYWQRPDVCLLAEKLLRENPAATYRDIANELGINEDNLALFARNLGLARSVDTRRKYTPDQEARYAELRAAGLQLRQIAAAMGVPFAVVDAMHSRARHLAKKSA